MTVNFCFHFVKYIIGKKKAAIYTANPTNDQNSLAHQIPNVTRNQNGNVKNIQVNVAAGRRISEISSSLSKIFMIIFFKTNSVEIVNFFKTKINIHSVK